MLVWARQYWIQKLVLQRFLTWIRTRRPPWSAQNVFDRAPLWESTHCDITEGPTSHPFCLGLATTPHTSQVAVCAALCDRLCLRCLRDVRMAQQSRSPPPTAARHPVITAFTRNQSHCLYLLWLSCRLFSKRYCGGRGGGGEWGGAVRIPLSGVRTGENSQSAVFRWCRTLQVILPSHLWIFCGQVGRSAGGRVENTVLRVSVYACDNAAEAPVRLAADIKTPSCSCWVIKMW